MAEESKQSGLASDQTKPGRSIGNASLDDSFSDLEESLDFDIYVEDIPLIAEANSDSSDSGANSASPIKAHFTDTSSDSSNPIPLNLSSFRDSDTDDYSDIGAKPFSEDDLDDILLKDDSSNQFDDDESIALSSSELNNITSDNDDYSADYDDSMESNYQPGGGKSGFASNNSFDSDELNDTYDTDIGDDDNITLGSDELDQILNPDEDDEEGAEDEFQSKSFFDTESENEEDGPIALSDEELNNITSPDDSEIDDFETENFISEPPADLFDSNDSSDEEIALSGDELNNLLESGGVEEDDFEEGETKSFFDSDEEEDNDDESIALSPDELSNITDSEYPVEDGIETDDLSSGIESNEFGVSTESVFGEDASADDENISLSGDELNNILETGEIEVEGEPEEEFDLDNAKSFFDSDEEEDDDESISLSADELGNITAEEDFTLDNESEASLKEDNFDLSESTQDLEMESTPNLFEEGGVEDEEIALSGDELNNLLESGEIETEEAESLGNSLFDDTTEEDESIALSPDELGNITAEEDFTLDNESEASLKEDNFDLSESTQDLEMESTPNLFEEGGVEDEEIALSGDELNNLLESGEIETEEAESLGNSLFDDTTEEDESIALSPDELGNITAGEDFEVENVDATTPTAEEDNFDLPDTLDDFGAETTANLFGENSTDEEEIALSGDELNNLLESGEIETEDAESNTPADDYSNPIDSGMVIGDDDFVIDDNSSLSDLGNFNVDDSANEETKDYSDKIESFQFGSVKKEELKKVISYMDELLGSLPDSYIKEFASSEYFELYKKIMNELEL
jgi:hypothetical protein